MVVRRKNSGGLHGNMMDSLMNQQQKMLERIHKINEEAQTNWEKAQGMLEMLNEICGTQYGWFAKRVVEFRSPNGSVAERYAHFNDLERKLRFEATH